MTSAKREADTALLEAAAIGSEPSTSSSTSEPASSASVIRTRLRRNSSLLLGVLGIVIFLAVWEAVPRFGLANSRYLPGSIEVFTLFFQNLGLQSFWVAVGLTTRAWAIGLAIAISGGLVLGLLIGSSPFLRKATHSTIEFLRPIPSVALIPLAVLLFGLRLESELLLIVYACFWIILIQMLYGVADVDKVADDTMRSFRFNQFARVRHLVWPTALPYLVTGMRLAASVGLILAITSELIIGTPGLGSEVAKAQANGAIAAMYALVITTGLLGVLVNLSMRFLERKVLFWHSSIRRDSEA